MSRHLWHVVDLCLSATVVRIKWPQLAGHMQLPYKELRHYKV